MAADNLNLDLPADERAAVVEELRAAAQRGVGVVRQVLAFARGGADVGNVLRPAPLLRDLGKLLRHLLPRSVGLAVEVTDDLWPVAGDGTQFYQVLMNLCVNARDAMPGGGTVTVTGANRVVEGAAHAQPGPYVRVSVADTGAGIPPEHLGRIFEPFFTTKPPGQGTGLGLATVSDILAAHGGFVTVESEVGRGTRFDTYWPAVERPPTGPDVPAGAGELVLVADGERSAAELARAALEAYGYRALAAHTAEAAADLLARHGAEVRAVLLDAALAVTPPAGAVVLWVAGESSVGPGHPGAVLRRPYSADDLLRALHAALHPPGGAA
jgi:hypothetical protein